MLDYLNPEDEQEQRDKSCRVPSHNESVLKIIPEFVLKHSLTIHRRGIRAREYRVTFSTEPPPTSVQVFTLCCGVWHVEREQTR